MVQQLLRQNNQTSQFDTSRFVQQKSGILSNIIWTSGTLQNMVCRMNTDIRPNNFLIEKQVLSEEKGVKHKQGQIRYPL